MYDFNNSKILISSSSVGFRTKERVGTRVIPFQVKSFKNNFTPWINYIYAKNNLRLYNTGFTVLDLLLFLEKTNIEIKSYTHFIGCFGIVEGWNRDKIHGDKDGEAVAWDRVINRLLSMNISKEYKEDIKKWMEEVKNNNKTKTIFSVEMWTIYLAQILKKLDKVKYKLFIIIDEDMVSPYTRDSISSFNKALISLQGTYSFDYFLLNKEAGFSTYDTCHFTLDSHTKIIQYVKNYLSYRNDNISKFKEFRIRIKEYLIYLYYKYRFNS